MFKYILIFFGIKEFDFDEFLLVKNQSFVYIDRDEGGMFSACETKCR